MKSKKFVWILAILVFLAGLVLISGLNKPHLSPFTTTMDLSYPTAAAYSEQGGVVVDTQGKRMAITDANRELTRLLDVRSSGSPIDHINDVTIGPEGIYVIGSRHFESGTYLSSESLLLYSPEGKLLKTLYSQTYEKDDFVSSEQFCQLLVRESDIFLTTSDGASVTILRFDGTESEPETVGTWAIPEPCFSIGYYPELHQVAFIGMSQACYRIDCRSNTVTPTEQSSILQTLQDYYHVDFSQYGLNNLKDVNCIPVLVYNIDGVAQFLIFLNVNSGEILVFSNDGGTCDPIKALDYSTSYLLTNLAFWLSLAFFVLFLLLLLLWLLLKKLSPRGCAILLILGGILLTSFFYTSNHYNQTEDTYRSFLVTQTKQTSLVLTAACGDDMDDIRACGISAFCIDPANQDVISHFRKVLKDFCDANVTKQSSQVHIFLYDRDGQLYTLADSTNSLPAGVAVFLSDDLKQPPTTEGKNTAFLCNNSYESYLYCYDFIYNSAGEKVGAVCACCYQGNLSYNQTTDAINLAVSLAAIFIAIYTSSKVFVTFRADLRRRKARDKTDTIGRTVDMAGLYAFVQTLIVSMDSAILVYVAKSLCTDMEPGMQAVMVALPSSAYAVGSLFGSILYSQIAKKVGERRLALLSSIATICVMGLLVFAILSSSIYLLILGKLLFGFFPGGLLYILSDTIPYNARDKETQANIIGSVIKASISGSIISILIGGLLSQFLSYSAIYCLGGALSVLILFLSISIFGKIKNSPNASEPTPKPSKNSPRVREHWTIFFKAPMVMFVLFYVLPWSLLGGYKSYLFPLYSAGAGISVLLLSNLTMFSKTLTYVMGGPLSRLTQRIDRRVLMVAPLFLICGSLLCFRLSPNIYWAIIVLFAADLMRNLIKVPKKMYISNVSEEYGLEQKSVQSNYFTIEFGIGAFQSPILSAFVSLGMNLACSAVGLVCGGMITVFGVYQRFRRKKPASSSSSSSSEK